MSRYISGFLRVLVCAVFTLIFLGSASAQFKAGIQGTVTDSGGGLVPEAKVSLLNSETGKTQETTTSADGFYKLSGLAPAKYKLTVEKAGYKQKVFNDVSVNAEAVQGLDVVLEPGDVSAVVTVTQETGETLQTENADVDKAITSQEVRALPQFARDPYELARLTPGVFGDAARGGTGGAVNLPNTAGPGGSTRSIFQTENAPQISANGQRITANNFQIDGTSVNSLTNGGAAVITPNQESVKEVRVIANAYSAEYGRNSGAQILTVSQNGTNNFHGSLFLKNNSPGLNAFNKYGGPAAPPTRVNQHLNQFGGSIGGPLYLPRFGEGGPSTWGGKNRAFFFFSYEGLRSRNTDTINSFIETPDFRQAVIANRPNSIAAKILSAPGVVPRIVSVTPVTCAFAGFNSNCQQLPGGLDIGRLAGAQGQYISFADLSGGGPDGIPDIQFAQLSVPTISSGNQFNPRFDFNLNDKDTLTFSSYVSHFSGLGGDGGGRSRPMGDITTAPQNLFGMFTWSRIISGSKTNELRFNATRFAFNELESSSQTNFGIPRIEIENLPFDRLRWGADWAETTPGIFSENTFELRDTFRWVRGNQAWSFGGEKLWEQENNDLSGGSRPLYTFAGLFNFANDTPLFYQINADPRTGGPAASKRKFRSSTLAFFGQNDWKVRPNFTLNLGLRWEYFSPLSEKDGVLSNLILGPAGSELTGARLAVVKSLYPADRNNFSPRVGFAYSPNLGEKFNGLLNENKLVLRGGFGIAYNRIPLLEFNNSRGNPPFLARYRICCGTSASDFSTPFNNGQILYALGASNSPFSYPANPALIATFNGNGIPILPGGASVEIWGAPAKVPTPYVYTFSLEGQYSLPAKMVGSLGYQGSRSRRLMRLVNENFFFSGSGAFSNIFFPTPDTNAAYDALIARVGRRFSSGFQFDAIYRFAKSRDVVSYEGPTANTNPTYPLDVRQEVGPSDFDVRHNFVASGLWELPIFRNRHDAAGNLLGGWQLSGILTAHTGFPWTPTTGQCASTRGPSICPTRPLAYFGGVGADTSNDAFITGSNTVNCPIRNAAGNVVGNRCFSLDSPGLQVPGIGRNVFRGPGYFNIDMAVAKKFGLNGLLSEGSFFEVKANVFNVFNLLNLQPFNFSSASTQIQNSLFGRAERGLAGRVIEIQGRLSF
ncbi:MAG TPA: carboxypeptidase regulatory-like domain-containing protein [Pyrinomonadaceae bacterium]|nr:carboxypeptidase regulatory-like domain-containing protein [Pyrinomonadaceae bacterium]